MVNFSFDNLEVIEGNNLNIEWGQIMSFRGMRCLVEENIDSVSQIRFLGSEKTLGGPKHAPYTI